MLRGAAMHMSLRSEVLEETLKYWPPHICPVEEAAITVHHPTLLVTLARQLNESFAEFLHRLGVP
jgi:hypothetical protein